MKVVSNGTLSIVLDGLDRYTVYRIEVWGETSKGGGPVATTFGGNRFVTQSLNPTLFQTKIYEWPGYD